MKKFFVLSLIFILLLNSCYVYKPIQEKIENKTIGGIEVLYIKNPRFNERKSPFNYFVHFGLVPLTTFTYGLIKDRENLGEWAVAAIVTLPLSAFMLYENWPNDTIPLKKNEANKWVVNYMKKNKLDNKYTYGYDKSDKFYLLPISEIPKYKAYNKFDVIFYSENTMANKDINSFIEGSSLVADVEALETIVEKFPNNEKTNLVKIAILAKQKNYSDFINKLSLYPNTISKDEACRMASNLVVNTKELQNYRRNFGEKTIHDDKIFKNIYNLLSEYSDLTWLIDSYPNASESKNAKKRLVSIAKNVISLTEIITKYGNEYFEMAEVKGVDIVYNDYTQFDSFIKAFPKSKYYANDVSESSEYIGLISNGKINGIGVKRFLDFYWAGSFSNGVLNGKGKFYGDYSYEGDFKNDKKEGYGVAKGSALSVPFGWLDVNDYIVYSGNWSNNQPNGKGKIECEKTGEWFDGHFSNGDLHGYGTFRFRNGVRMSGNWKESDPDGDMVFEKWTLLGLISEKKTYSCYSWADIYRAGNNFVGVWNSKMASKPSSSSSSSCYSISKLKDGGILGDDYYVVKCLTNGRDIGFYIDKESKYKPYYVRGVLFRTTFETFEEGLKYIAKEFCDCNQ